MPEEFTQRGFAVFAKEIETTYGDVVEVQESSAAMGPHCWLRIRGEAHLTEEPRGHDPRIANGALHAHLNIEQAERVRDALTEFIEFSKERWGDA